MYSYLLLFHSWTRWAVLILLLITLVRSYYGWLKNLHFSKLDNQLRDGAISVVNIQFLLGLGLYGISPISRYFLEHTREALQMREIRFFGLEHITMMITAIAVLTIGSSKAKRAKVDRSKFKIMAVWFSIGLLLILSSIPWEFSPLISRPHFRNF